MNNIAERRAALLHAAAQVAHHVTSILDLDQLLSKTVDVICDEFGFYYAGVFLLDKTGGWAILRAARGQAGEKMIAQGHKLQVGGRSMIGSAINQHQARIALDVGQDSVHFDNPHLPLTRSEMALPLLLGDKAIGAVTVQSTQEAAFSDDDITALQAMADQLAIAINNALLHTENQALLAAAERRARLLEAAAEVGHGVTSILDLDELLNKTVDIICDAYDFYFSCIYLIDEGGGWLILRAAHGQAGRAMLDAHHRLKVGGKSMNGTVAVEGKARIALNVDQDPKHMKNPLLPDTRSEMVMPLLVSGKLIGTLAVQSTHEAAFNQDDITTLQTMADQLAIAINNARLHQQNVALLAQTEQRARLLQAAAQVGHGVTSILDLDELLKKTVDIICDAYGFYFSCVYLLDEAKEWLILRAAYGIAGAQMLNARHKLQVGGQSMNGTVAVEGQARIALNVDQDPKHLKNPLLPDTRSEMVMPLAISGELIGTLAVQSTQEAAFTQDDITTLQTMADQLAIAINNARLLRDLKAAHAELVRNKTFEALATSTIEAIHWIGNKALPISTSVDRLRQDVEEISQADAELLESIREDLGIVDNNAKLIVSVQEHMIGPARDQKPQPAMLDDVVKDAIVERKVPAGVIATKIASELPLAWADTTQLSRAVGYVLENALEAIQDADGGKITVSIAPTDDNKFVAIRIADTGPGIPEQDLDKVWATFYTTKGTGHAGLGLSATLRILRQIDGQVEIENIPGAGVQVSLLAPALDDTPAAVVSLQDKNVLLIDDDDPWSRFAQNTLRLARNSVTVSSDVPPDLESFDTILLDNVLENGDSLTILKVLRKTGAHVKTTVVASSIRVERTMALMNRGAKDVVDKPYTAHGLAKLLT
ncbi:MAG: GAF domain-containing protein [Anaerolineae bacterium]|nr:GAF domain-containing protein [Anaerolineae bacterium]